MPLSSRLSQSQTSGIGSSTDRGAFSCTALHKVIPVEIAARADLPIKYEFILESGWRRLVWMKAILNNKYFCSRLDWHSAPCWRRRLYAVIRATRSSNRTSESHVTDTETGDAKAHPLGANDERELLF